MSLKDLKESIVVDIKSPSLLIRERLMYMKKHGSSVRLTWDASSKNQAWVCYWTATDGKDDGTFNGFGPTIEEAVTDCRNRLFRAR